MKLGLLVLEDERMMSWHPRTPPFIHLFPTSTRHPLFPSIPLVTQWSHFPYFLIGCSHASQFLLCHENSHGSFPFVLSFPQPTFTPMMISCHGHMSQATLVVYKDLR